MYYVRQTRSKPQLLPEFESGSSGRHAYRDRHFKREAIKVLPGEYCVSNRDVLLVTTLGSCVAACIRDPLAGVGGLNHFLLPDGGSDPASDTARYGSYAMEMLINELIKRGASRSRLEAKAFGGANVNRSLNVSMVGLRNAAFVKHYLADEGIALLAADLGLTHPRKVYYWPQSGRVMVQSLPIEEQTELQSAERLYIDRLGVTPVAGDVELF